MAMPSAKALEGRNIISPNNVNHVENVEEMTREEVLDEILSRTELVDEITGTKESHNHIHLAYWSTGSLRALLLLTREKASEKQDGHVHPQLGISLALRVSAVLSDQKIIATYGGNEEIKTKTPPDGSASEVNS